jgi:hypothetical protein
MRHHEFEVFDFDLLFYALIFGSLCLGFGLVIGRQINFSHVSAKRKRAGFG